MAVLPEPVPHKGELLELVDRLIVIANHQVVMDGPRQQVLARLSAPPPQITAPPAQTAQTVTPKVSTLKPAIPAATGAARSRSASDF